MLYINRLVIGKLLITIFELHADLKNVVLFGMSNIYSQQTYFLLTRCREIAERQRRERERIRMIREREERDRLQRERERLEIEKQKLERERMERERLERERIRIEQVNRFFIIFFNVNTHFWATFDLVVCGGARLYLFCSSQDLLYYQNHVG